MCACVCACMCACVCLLRIDSRGFALWLYHWLTYLPSTSPPFNFYFETGSSCRPDRLWPHCHTGRSWILNPLPSWVAGMAACATVPNRVPLSMFTNVLRVGQLKYFFSVFYFSGHFNPVSSFLLFFLPGQHSICYDSLYTYNLPFSSWVLHCLNTKNTHYIQQKQTNKQKTSLVPCN